MKTRTLVIVRNKYYSKHGVSYVELVYDPESMSTEETYLQRRPRAARFDAVLETGEGSFNQWNAGRAARVYGHPLQKTRTQRKDNK